MTRVKASLIIRGVADAENVTVDEKEIATERDAILSHYAGDDDANIREEINNAEYDSHLKHLILARKVMTLLSTIANGAV